MGKVKKTKKFALVKRRITAADPRLKVNEEKLKKAKAAAEKKKQDEVIATKIPTAMFFRENTELGPPYHVLVDTNFINFTLQNRLEMVTAMMDCLYAKCIPCITDCVMAELEKLGIQYRMALRVAKDPRFKRLTCLHRGTYADDCIVKRVQADRIYIVATCDRDLRRRLRKIPGVPLMHVAHARYEIERMPGAFGAKN